MAVYERKGRNDVASWIVDFIRSDPSTGVTRRVRRAAKDPKGRPARSKTAAEQHELRLRTALSAGTMKVGESAGETASDEDAPLLTA